MNKNEKSLNTLDTLLANIETELRRVRFILNNIKEGKFDDTDVCTEDVNEIASKLMNYSEGENIKVVEGVYDGYFMVGSDNKKYPVPMNYSSKTKLVPGDIMKLRVMADGKLLYKLIGQANRNYIKAVLSKSEEEKYIGVTDDGKIYDLNQAAVTFFKGKAGDELSIIVNPESGIKIAAIEAIISN
ncbi:hypothetical protein [Candidatus Vampirococcus lugosii]|uniref:50S ribosomal protein L7/L12 n=1 Tax=Candidatus Vampirococcus lugosii TaxID=2789015 RepID=A0ABS5QMY7_9BACT|nr:hypothetical protein [Candidatus Vampirococcus lugosii]MBS8122565.1 hypothetical protein [Candidatus Vampirococcus lugosii]